MRIVERPYLRVIAGLALVAGAGCGASPPRSASMVTLAASPAGTASPEAVVDRPVVSAAAPAPMSPAHFSFVTQVMGKSVIVLDAAAAAEWRKERSTLLTHAADLTRVRAEADADVVPETHRLGDEHFVLYEGNQPLCRVKLGAPWIVGQMYEPGFDWAGTAGRTPAATQDEIASDAWNYASAWLVADISPEPGCEKASWARAASLPPPSFAEVFEPPPDVARRAEAALATLDGYRSAQLGYDEWQQRMTAWGNTARKGAWDEDPSGERTQIAYTFRGQKYVSVSARVGGACDFSAGLHAVFRVRGPHLDLSNVYDSFAPDGTLLDLNGDGHLELIGIGDGGPFMRAFDHDGIYAAWSSLEISSPGCKC
jgi:hypothetical protein